MNCHSDQNKERCTCTRPNCSRHGICCECVAHHTRARQLPACFFPADVERTYDRSFERFARCVADGKA